MRSFHLILLLAIVFILSSPEAGRADANKDWLTGKLARLRGETDSAEIFLRRAATAGHAPAALDLVRLLTDCGRSVEGQMFLEQALADPATAAEAALWLANRELAADRIPAALPVLRQVLARQPGHAGLRQKLAELLIASAAYAEAALVAGEWVRQEPRNPVGLELWLVALQESGQLEEALAACRRLRQLEPANPGYGLIEASLCFALGRLDECGRILSLLARRHPELPEVHLQRGILCETQGDRQAAERYYRIYLEALPVGERDAAVRDLARMMQEAGKQRRIRD